MTPSVSFLELRLEQGELLAVLGSGLCEDVLARDVSQPYLRVCMRDPEVVDYRVRCGTAELTDEGLDYCQWDDFQYRGASIRLFAWSTSIVRWIGGNPEAFNELLLERSCLWLEFRDGEASGIEERQARRALAASDPADESRLFIEFHVPQAQVVEVLSLLRKDQDSDGEI